MASLIDICEGLKANLDQIPNLQVSPVILANPTPPAADIQPDETEWDKAFGRGLDERRMIVRVFVALTTDVGGQRLLYQFLNGSGSLSVKAAIESDPRLGGIVDDLHVTRTSKPQRYAEHLLGCEWTVRVLAPGIT